MGQQVVFACSSGTVGYDAHHPSESPLFLGMWIPAWDQPEPQNGQENRAGKKLLVSCLADVKAAQTTGTRAALQDGQKYFRIMCKLIRRD